MRKIKFTSIAILVSLILGVGVYIAHLEFVVIPDLLSRRLGQGAYVAHFGALIVLMVGSVATGAWAAKRTIFRVHTQLMDSHLNTLINSIGNLATGYWSSDSQSQRGAFVTGAKIGHSLRNEIVEPDRSEISEQIGALNVPVQQAPGQSNEVISDMSDYLDDLDRKRRLAQ